jgi:hypothetical protein
MAIPAAIMDHYQQKDIDALAKRVYDLESRMNNLNKWINVIIEKLERNGIR